MNLCKLKCLLLFLCIFYVGCSSKKDFSIVLVHQRLSQHTYLKEYYVLKNYKSDSMQKKKIDSLALELGRGKGRPYRFYSANFFISSHRYKIDTTFFRNADSLSMITKRKNLFNYLFYNGGFREKQIIKDGKILPPLYDSVRVIYNSNPVITFEN